MRIVRNSKTCPGFAAAILAAGSGARMKSDTPKPLHAVCGKEMLLHVVDSVRGAGISSIAVVTPPDSRPFQDALGESVLHAIQSQPLGTGHALLQARGALGMAENILALYGDVPLIRASTLSSLMLRHIESEAYATILTSRSANPDGMGRILRKDDGRIEAIVEERNADADTKAIREVNTGFYCFRASWLWQNLARMKPSTNGEVLLTDLVEAASAQKLTVESVLSEDPRETMGVNNRIQLAQAESVARQRICERWMLDGITMPDDSSVYIDCGVTLGQDTTVLPNTHILGKSAIGSGCTIGPNAIIDNSSIGNGCQVVSSVVRDSTLESEVDVGPFSHIRGGSYVESGVHIGTSAEIKNSRLGQGAKMGHFSYMGDATLGANVNIGAGAITCNFDGESKHETAIGQDAFIGSDTMLVAPVKIGDRAATGAGSVVTRDVPDDSTVIGVPARIKSTGSERDAPSAPS